MTRIRIIASLLLVVAAAALAASPASAQETALIRFVHLHDDSPTVDISLNGEVAAADLSFGETTTRVNVPAGLAEISAELAGAAVSLFSERTTLAPGPSTIIFRDAGDSQFSVIREDLSSIAFGEARLTVLNALDADLHVTARQSDETMLLERVLAAGAASRPIDTAAGFVDIWVESSAGDTAERQFSRTLDAGTVNLVIAHGTASQPRLFKAESSAQADDATGQLRFVHAIEGAAPVELRVNGKLIVPALEFAVPTPRLALPGGSHAITVNLGAAEIMSERLNIRAGEMSTVVLMRTSVGLGIFDFADATGTVDERSAVVKLINAIPDSVINYLQFADGAITGLNVPLNHAGDPAKIVPGQQAMTLHLSIGGVRGEIALPAHYFSSGSLYTLVALPGGVFSAPRLLIAETSVKRQIRATMTDESIVSSQDEPPGSELDAPAGETAVDEPSTELETQAEGIEVSSDMVDEAEAAEPATEQVAAASEREPAPSATPASMEPSLTSYAIVNVNPESALHMRQYPSSDAMSLGLLPAESNLMILGRRGPSQFGQGEPASLPVDLSEYRQDAAALLPLHQDLPAADTWLYAIYTTPEGGAIVGWTNAYYLKVYNRVGDPQRLAFLPLVPQNRPGGSHSTGIQPADLDEYVAARVTGLNPDALLNLRRGNDAEADILALLPADTILRFLGLDAAAAWALVEYQPLAGNQMRGWVSMNYIQLLLNGKPVRVDALRALDPSAVPIIGGAVLGGVMPSTPSAPDAPLEGVVGEVTVNIDSALHLRRHPDATSESLALIPAETVLQMEGVTENRRWYKARYDGESGWVASAYIVLSRDGRRLGRASLENQLPRFNDLGF